MSSTWFTSDHHFGHGGMLEFGGRKFSSTMEMDEELIERWNSCIKENHRVYHLGDFALGSTDYVMNIMARLNGEIFFIEGNHDRWIKRTTGFGNKIHFLPPVYEFKVNHRTLVMCHYALRSWNKSHYGSYHIYGHHHGMLEPYGRSFDVGVDTNNYYPYSLEEVFSIMETLTPIIDFSNKEKL